MGKFPVQYMGSLANGICMGGLIPVLLNLLILSMDVDIQMAGFYCFLLSSFIVLVVFFLYSHMRKTEFYRYYTAERKKSGEEYRLLPSLTYLKPEFSVRVSNGRKEGDSHERGSAEDSAKLLDLPTDSLPADLHNCSLLSLFGCPDPADRSRQL